MKSLILKDIYNILPHYKTTVLIMVFLAFFFIPFQGPEAYIVVCGVLSSMMIISTFSFDDFTAWPKYAMVMPVSRKELVLGKFMVLLLMSAAGSVFGLLFGTIGGLITKKLDLGSEALLSLLCVTLSAVVCSLVMGSMTIALVFKFGPERGRILFLFSFLVPAAICLGIVKLMELSGIAMTDGVVMNMIMGSPIAAVIWGFVMYKISFGIFSRQEF